MATQQNQIIFGLENNVQTTLKTVVRDRPM